MKDQKDKQCRYMNPVIVFLKHPVYSYNTNWWKSYMQCEYTCTKQIKKLLSTLRS